MSRARRLGRAIASGGKSTAVSGGAGVATYFAHKLLSQKVSMARDNPIATPLVMVTLGHFLRRRMPTVASGLIGAGGYALGLAIDVKRANAAAQQTQTSALLQPSNVAALLESSNVGTYELPDAADDGGDVDYSSAMRLGLDG